MEKGLSEWQARLEKKEPHPMKIKLLFVAALLAGLASGLSGASNPNGFAVYRGVNISHWLSQVPKEPWPNQELLYTELDAAFLAAAGFDHIRLPVDEQELWDDSGRQRERNWARLERGIEASLRHNLAVVLDLHIVRSHHFNASVDGRQENTLFTDPGAQERLLEIWREISTRMGYFPNNRVAYEILNEAVADDHEQWNLLVAKAHAAIRELEPERTLVIGSNRWQRAGTFPELRVPSGDPNIILSFHDYHPMMITHYKASWVPTKGYTGPVQYPGLVVREEDLAGLDADTAQAVRNFRGLQEWNRKALVDIVQVAVDRAEELGLPLYCGEFGCLPTPGRDIRLRYYRDMVSVLDQFGLARANWDYKGGFSIVDARTLEADAELIHILTGWVARE